MIKKYIIEDFFLKLNNHMEIKIDIENKTESLYDFLPDSAFTNDYTLHDNNNEQSFLFEQEIKSMFPDYNILPSFEDTFKITPVPIYDRNENSEVLLEKSKKKFNVEYKPKNYFEEEINKINKIIEQFVINKEDRKRLLLDINKDNIKDNIYIKNIKEILTKSDYIRKSKQPKESTTEKEKEEKHQLGRKRKSDDSKRKRNKYNADNIIKKIKNRLNDFILEFINKLISDLFDIKKINEILLNLNLPKLKSNNKNQIIKKIEHKSIANKTKKEDNLKILNLNLKEYLSNNISSKYNISNKKYNRLLISKLHEYKEKENILNFVFSELKISDWLQIYTHQKNIENYFYNYSLSDEEKKPIKNNISGIEKSKYSEYIKKLEKGDKIYYYCFIILIYNFKLYLLLKEGRIHRNLIK